MNAMDIAAGDRSAGIPMPNSVLKDEMNIGSYSYEQQADPQIEKFETTIENNSDTECHQESSNRDVDMESPRPGTSATNQDLKKDVRPYICNICNARFSIQQSFKLHFTEHDRYKPYGCTECRKRFHTKTNLLQHIWFHKGPKIPKHCCEHCGKKFHKSRALTLHLRTHEPKTGVVNVGLENYKCDECELSFSLKVDIVKHLRTHVTERPFPCNRCDKRFITKPELRLHCKRKHQHICEKCLKSFPDNLELAIHELVHTKGKSFICKECGEESSCKRKLAQHERTHLPKSFECEICGKPYVKLHSLRKHQLSHIGNDN